MKKALCLALALTLCACCMAEGADIAGVWYLNGIETNGASLDPASFGLELTLKLNADGSAEANFSGDEAAACSWRVEGGLFYLNDGQGETVGTYSQDALTISYTGVKMIFSREARPTSAFDAGAVRDDATLADFDGAWRATIMDMLGMRAPVERMGLNLRLNIDQGRVEVCVEGNESVRYAVDAEFSDGVLTVPVPEDASQGFPLRLELRESGALSHTQDEGDGLSSTIYFERVE